MTNNELWYNTFSQTRLLLSRASISKEANESQIFNRIICGEIGPTERWTTITTSNCHKLFRYQSRQGKQNGIITNYHLLPEQQPTLIYYVRHWQQLAKIFLSFYTFTPATVENMSETVQYSMPRLLYACLYCGRCSICRARVLAGRLSSTYPKPKSGSRERMNESLKQMSL